MFQSLEFQRFFGHDHKIHKNIWQYKLTDSDFETDVFLSDVGGVVAVIDVYKKRNLNVASNLIKTLLYCSKKWNFSVNELIESGKKYNSNLSKYENDLQKYLVLL
jgi:hypothetical protein